MNYYFIRRLYIFGLTILVIALFYSQIIRGNYYLERAKNNYVRVIPLRSKRGTIYDRNGLPLAYDNASFNIAVIPCQIKNKKDSLFRELAAALGSDINIILRNYSRELINYFSPIDVAINIDKSKAFQIQEKFKDVLIDPQPRRYYPYPREFSHILGYVKRQDSFYESFKKYGYAPSEYAGVTGIEQYYDSYLKGEDGGNLIEINARGQVVGFLGEQKAHKGQDIYLTIDARWQKIVFDELGGRIGAVIIMDSQSGEIIAMVSSPAFDPNQFLKGKGLAEMRDERHPLLNRAIQSACQMGSTIKPIIALAALQEKKITPASTFICNGTMNLGRASFHCLHTHGAQDLYQGIAHSCNIYFYNVALRLGPDNITKWAKRFRLDAVTDIDLPYEGKGFMPTVEWKERVLKSKWFDGDTCNLAIGQGSSQVTPLENLLAMNVFATSGYLVRPHLFKKVEDTDSGFGERNYLGADIANIDIVKTGLRDVVEGEGGTAHILKELNLKIAGKTGTAQVGPGKSPHGWFLGFFPYDNPRYTFCVFLEHGQSSYIAVKAFKAILKKAREGGIL
jgi:penicillin-binding protein 2